MFFRAPTFLNARLLRDSAALSAVFVLVSSAPFGPAQEAESIEAGPIRLEAVPTRFEIWQDEPGFTWQVNRQGTLLSGEIPYFQGGLALFVSGSPFSPVEGVRHDGGQASEDGARLSLEQKGDFSVTRDIWFDARRGGVRVIDSVVNNGKREETVRVDLKSSFQSPWQDLHGTEGRILGSKPGSGLGSRDFGVVVKFSQAEGRHDTLFVTSSEKDAQRPMISYSSNQRELTFSYDLALGPGKRASLVHWVVQRNLRTPADAEDALKPFYQRRRLVDPGVPKEIAAQVRNFDPQSFPEEGVKPYNLDALVALNAVVEDIDSHRRGEDILWITPENQLAGEVNPEASLEVTTAYGKREAGITDVAAIQGGAGIGRTPRIFLRDGRVWSGPIAADNLTIKIAEGFNVEELKPAELALLLLRVGNGDGRPPGNTALFIGTRSGDVLAVSDSPGADGDPPGFPILSPWGEDRIALKDLGSLFYTNGAAPKFRIRREDGSRLTVLLKAADLDLTLAGGEKLLLPANAVASAWKAEVIPPRSEFLADEWFEFEDIGMPEEELPRPASLLLGNNLLAGEFAMEELNLVSGSAVTPLNPTEITGIQLSPDADADQVPVFEIELLGGEVLTGRLRERVVFIESGGRIWRVPVQHFVAYRGTKE